MDVKRARDRALAREGNKLHVFLAMAAYLTASQPFSGCIANNCCYWDRDTREQSLRTLTLFRHARPILPKGPPCVCSSVPNLHRGLLCSFALIQRERLHFNDQSIYLRSITCPRKWIACFSSKWAHSNHCNYLLRNTSLSSNQKKKTIIRMIRGLHQSSVNAGVTFHQE